MELAYSQNFLRSGRLVERLLDASTIGPGDLVLDLGAGTGVLSTRLARRGCDVVAIEKDARLVQQLRATFAGATHVRVLHCDIFEIELPRRPYKVFSNSPFDATAAIVHRLTCATRPPQDAYLVMQREAADRFVGEPRATLVAALLFPWYEATRLHRFRRTDFMPVPRVEVDMLRLRKRGPPLVCARDAQLYRNFVSYLFTARQPCLEHSLRRLIGKRRANRLACAFDVADTTPTRVAIARWLALFEAARCVVGDDLRCSVAHACSRSPFSARSMPLRGP
jgi:23S rRNA (adenine-N6)-dimethyltransferase